MNTNEIKGLSDILHDLSSNDLFSIMETTTKHMIKAENRAEALEIILAYTDKASTLLRRRKIKKTALFEYLRQHDIVVSVEGEKADYVKACLNYWQSTDNQASCEEMEEQDSTQTDVQPAMPLQPVAQLTLSSNEVLQLGIQFSTWFFNCLNTLQDFGPQHFWNDCKLWLNLKLQCCKEEEFCVMGAVDVAAYFCNYVTNDKLFFKPNSSREAVRSHQEQHGLVKVTVSGVIHQLTNCIGLFDVAFGLVNDPLSNYTWKVKLMQMVMQTNTSVKFVAAREAPYLCQ